MRNLVSRWCFLALLFVPLATSTAWAQTFTGGVRGVVNDSGGVVPGVTVTLINEANGASRDAVSNDQGEYNFAAVPPGNYTVKAELTGFKTFENKAIRIGAQQFVTLDIKLEVGQLQETITVTGEAPLIDTSNASTGGVIDSSSSRRCRAAAVRRSSSPSRCPRSSPRATRSSTASRIRPTRRCCRSAAARAAATTTWSTACRSPTCATAPRPTRRSRPSTT